MIGLLHMGYDRIYAIGDIHGHLDKLRVQHDWIARDGGGTIVHVGDLVDRGPNSAGVLDYLIKGIQAGEPWVVLKGNHDRMMARYLEPVPKGDGMLRSDYTWLSPPLGGQTTLASYGILKGDGEDTVACEVFRNLHGRAPATSLSDTAYHRNALAAVPATHLDFLRGLDTYFRHCDALFVHAGIRPGIALDRQVEDDLTWIREPFLSDRRDHGQLIVHGHTPIKAATHYGNRVNIDSGVAFGGPLSTIVIEGPEISLLTPDGRKELRPRTGD